MSQHDMDIANQAAAALRADLNNALQALASTSSGTAAPSTTYPNQFWYETDTGYLYFRNEANSANILVGLMNQSTNYFNIHQQARVFDGNESSYTEVGSLQRVGSATLAAGVSTHGGLITGANFKAAVDTLIATTGIGTSQTWQDVSSSRAVSTVYQNTTGKPIQVNVDTNADVVLQLSADNSTYISVGTTLNGVTAIVPDDHYYKVNGSATVGYWAELR
tara:strand:+ start:537 stop:1196 length:660 start_codon:yes stop_codon:yes gene_type:complete